MPSLAEKKCVACEGKKVPILTEEQIANFAKELGNSWLVINEHHLEKEYTFKDFKEALEFTNKVGALAEQEKHHPDIHLSFGKVRIVLWTHSISALSENDFVLAAKIEKLNPTQTKAKGQ